MLLVMHKGEGGQARVTPNESDKLAKSTFSSAYNGCPNFQLWTNPQTNQIGKHYQVEATLHKIGILGRTKPHQQFQHQSFRCCEVSCISDFSVVSTALSCGLKRAEWATFIPLEYVSGQISFDRW